MVIQLSETIQIKNVVAKETTGQRNPKVEPMTTMTMKVQQAKCGNTRGPQPSSPGTSYSVSASSSFVLILQAHRNSKESI